LLAADARAAAISTGSLIGGIADLAGAASAASTITGLATFTRGLDVSGNAAGEASGAVDLARPFIASADAISDVSGDLSLVTSWYQLVVPDIIESYPMPDTNGSLRTSLVRHVTVFGDENGLFTSEQGAIAEGADEYGAIPFGTRYIWYGGHVNLTDDPAIRDLWLAHGFEVEIVQVP